MDEMLYASGAGCVGNVLTLAGLIVSGCGLDTEDTVDALHGCLQRSSIFVIALDDFRACLMQRLCRRLIGITGECFDAPAFCQQMTGRCTTLPAGCPQD